MIQIHKALNSIARKPLVFTFLIPIFALQSQVPGIVSTEKDRKSVSVTVYNQGMGLVRESRLIKPEKGDFTLRFEDVPSQILPQTVRVKSEENKSLTVYEQNYEFDLISQDRLLEKYVGKDVTLYPKQKGLQQTNGIKAKLISNKEGQIYQIGDEIVMGYFGRISVPELPDNLYSKPTLVWKLKNENEKEQLLDVSYQTQGMSWTADYNLMLDKEEEQATVASWITLNNTSGARFENATLQLIAGKVQFAEEPQHEYTKRPQHYKTLMKRSDMVVSAPVFEQENLSEYYLYTLDQPSTIGSNQTKQLKLFQAENIGIKKYFVFENLPMNDGDEKQFNNASVRYIFKNTKKNNLGRAIPAGVFRVFKADSKGRQQLLGEENIDHTPENEDIKIKTGYAFDVVANGRRVSQEVFKLGKGDKTVYSAEFRNRKKEEVEVRFYSQHWGDWNITKSSAKFTKESANRAYFDLILKPNETVTLDYTVETKY